MIRKNGWTGGQYSVFRALFGAYLFVHFAHLVPWGEEVFSSRGALPDAAASPLSRLFPNVLSVCDAPWFVVALLVAAALASVVFALGWRDRVAAVFLWYVWACLLGRDPLISNPSIPFVGWLLLAHACIPVRPFGSLDARGRADPGGGWSMPRGVHAAAWIVMAAGYGYSGMTKLASPSWLDGTAFARVLACPLARPGFVREALLALPSPLLKGATWGVLALELGFPLLALSRHVRPFAWSAMLGLHLGLVVLVDFADLSLGMVVLHLFTFDPAWIPGKEAAAPDRVFYDGHCGLCHRSVRFLLAEDRLAVLRFAPLGSEAFGSAVPDAERAALPDSIVVVTPDGRALVRSSGILRLLSRLGGGWRVVGALLSLIPSSLRDLAYDGVARVRLRLFARPPEACPIVPKELRERFLT